MDIQKMIIEKSKELAKRHAEIVENECKSLCEKYNITTDNLIIKYHINNEIEIDVKGVHFQITNEFVINKETHESDE